MEGSGVGSGGYVVHLMCMESELCCGLLQSSCYTEHGRYIYIWSVLTVCRNCAVHEQCWVCVVCWSLNYAVKFYCC